jgi:hypothetical protein
LHVRDRSTIHRREAWRRYAHMARRCLPIVLNAVQIFLDGFGPRPLGIGRVASQVFKQFTFACDDYDLYIGPTEIDTD